MSQVQITKESINNALAALEAQTQELVRGSFRLNDSLEKAEKKIWRQFLIIWTVGIVLAIFYFAIQYHKPVVVNQTQKRLVDQSATGATPGPDRTLESPALPSKVLAVSPTSEQDHLIKLLGQIREAQLKKDIDMFMGAYSPDFPESDQKRETTLKIWRRYTYVDSQFKLTDLQQENPLTISGNVSWNIKAQDQKTGIMRIIEKSYCVTFSKKSGVWLIHNIEKLDKQ